MKDVKASENKAPKAPGNQFGNEPKRNTITVGIELEGYEKMKDQFRNLEATIDRILEKQKLIGIDLASDDDYTGYSKVSRL